MGIEKRLIEDANLTRGMQLATPERITKVIPRRPEGAR